MKHLPLKAVMTRLKIIETDEGYELHSPAGAAKYDAWGGRCEVNGIPEYFPSSISLEKRKRVPAATAESSSDDTDATIQDGGITNAKIGNELHSYNTPNAKYTVSIGVSRNELHQNKVTFTTNGFGIYSGINSNMETIIQNAMAANEETERLRKAMKDAAADGAKQALDTIAKDFRSNGHLRRLLGI